MKKNELQKLAELVDEAAQNTSAIGQLSLEHSISLEDAYSIQELSIQRRLDRGETLTGIKMGFTSRSKMQQMGVEEMIWGRLTNEMLIEDGGEVELSKFIHPRAEPEIAFFMKKELTGVVSPLEAMSAVEAIAPAIEIIDSRYDKFKFTLEDVIADNCSSSGYVIGNWHKPDIDIANLGMIFEFNSKAVGISSSAAILGHPARSLAAASRLLAKNELTIQPGWIVMAGASTAAEALPSNTYVQCEIEKLDRVGFYSI